MLRERATTVTPDSWTQRLRLIHQAKQEFPERLVFRTTLIADDTPW